jgi:hypothetical protein
VSEKREIRRKTREILYALLDVDDLAPESHANGRDGKTKEVFRLPALKECFHGADAQDIGLYLQPVHHVI